MLMDTGKAMTGPKGNDKSLTKVVLVFTLLDTRTGCGTQAA